MKAMLLILTILMFSLNGFAKTKLRKVKPQLKFTAEVYYKLSYQDRMKYLQAFIDIAVEMEKAKNKTSASHKSFDLYSLLFPSAEANGHVCLAGGIFFDRPAGVTNCDREMTTLPDSVRTADAAGSPSLASFYTCGPEKRCGSYFGVNTSGQGFCFTNFRSATSECQAASTAGNGVQNLASRLANCSANGPFCNTFRTAMTRDQEKMAAYCDAGRSAGACRRARETIASLTALTGGNPAAATPTPIMDATSGCSERDLQAMQGEAFGSIERQLGFERNSDTLWMYMANMAQHACGTYRDPQQILSVIGVCQAPPAEAPRCETETARLSDCIAADFSSGSISDFAGRVNRQQGIMASNYCRLQTAGTQIWLCGDDHSRPDRLMPILALRTALQRGDSTGQLGRIAAGLCPQQTQARATCMARPASAQARSTENPANVGLWLTDNRYFDARRGVDALLAGQLPTDSAVNTEFTRAFGVSPREFKDIFCATSTSDFYAKTHLLRSSPRGQNPVRDRMRACVESNVRTVDDGLNDPRRQSNFGSRNCTMSPVTGVTRDQATNYLYHEQRTGLCRRGTDVVSVASNARPPGEVIVPCRGSDIVGATAPPQSYIKLEHTVAGSPRPPVYACLDNIITGGAGILQVQRFQCSAVDASAGDGPEAPAVQQ